MVFSSQISKFGKGENLSLFMESKEKILIYYFNESTYKKEILISDNNLSLNKTDLNLPYNEVIQIDDFLITRIDKSLGIKCLWKINSYM